MSAEIETDSEGEHFVTLHTDADGDAVRLYAATADEPSCLMVGGGDDGDARGVYLASAEDMHAFLVALVEAYPALAARPRSDGEAVTS